MKEITDIGAQRLVEAIIKSGTDEYRMALRMYMREHERLERLYNRLYEASDYGEYMAAKYDYNEQKYVVKKAVAKMVEIEVFYRSEWFAQLTDLDPDVVMKKAREVSGL